MSLERHCKCSDTVNGVTTWRYGNLDQPAYSTTRRHYQHDCVMLTDEAIEVILITFHSKSKSYSFNVLNVDFSDKEGLIFLRLLRLEAVISQGEKKFVPYLVVKAGTNGQNGPDAMIPATIL